MSVRLSLTTQESHNHPSSSYTEKSAHSCAGKKRLTPFSTILGHVIGRPEVGEAQDMHIIFPVVGSHGSWSSTTVKELNLLLLSLTRRLPIWLLFVKACRIEDGSTYTPPNSVMEKPKIITANRHRLRRQGLH